MVARPTIAPFRHWTSLLAGVNSTLGEFPPDMTTLLLVNPVAGHGRGGKVGQVVRLAAEQAWGPVQLLETSGPGAATSLARSAAEAGAERIVVVGGDGTIHEAANGILRLDPSARPPLGIIPAGTGNDFAKLLRTAGCRPAEAIRRIARGRIDRFDVGYAWDEYFLNSVGIGFDAEVARRVNASGWGRGFLAYLAAVGHVIRHFEPFPAELDGDDHRSVDRWLLLEVGNGPVVGGGFRITPDAVPDDGLLDVCAIQGLSPGGILAKLPLVLLGKHTGLKQVRTFRTTRLSIRRLDGPLVAQFDGELRSVADRMDVTILPRALPVLVAA